MFSHKLQLSAFFASFNLAYQGRRPSVDIKLLNPRILNIVKCLYADNLIQAYFFYACKKKRFLRIIFRYTNGQRPLFSRIRPCWRHSELTNREITQWFFRKGSLVYPILFLQLSNIGILTDRQLFHLIVLNRLNTYSGGNILARIDN